MAHIGQSTIYTSILTNKQRGFERLNPKMLSAAAKFRLRFIDNYLTNTRNASQTCRLFGIPRSLLYKWLSRYNPQDLSTLEGRSCRPHHMRQTTYNTDIVKLIRRYRTDKDTATYSARKLAWIFKRDYPNQPQFHLSPSTIGRIIAKFKLFFTEVVKAHERRSKRARQVWSELKRRKPYGLMAVAPRSVIEFDMKHIYIGSSGPDRYYAFCAIDPFTKEAVVHVAKTASSRQARLVLEKVMAVFGNKIVILNDNGSENMGEAWQYLAEQKIVQYFARPHTPKDKPYVERLIGSYQRECLDQCRSEITSLTDLDCFTTRWLNNYHYFRPHDSLMGQTPDEYCATLGLTITRRKVSTR